MHDLIIGTLSFIAGVWFGGVIMALLGGAKCSSCRENFKQCEADKDEISYLDTL